MSGTQAREALASNLLTRYGNTPGNRQVVITADELRSLIGRVAIAGKKSALAETVETPQAEPITAATVEARVTPKRTAKRTAKRAKKTRRK